MTLTVEWLASAGLVLTCSECGTVAEYPSPNGGPGTTASLDEINDDALMHAGEHS